VQTPDDTPARLVAAATQLIAEGGEEATSLRAVSRAARSNAAAVHYHFGGRDELLAAVLASLLEPVHRRRLELLDEARRRHGDQVPVAAVADALVRPDLELLARLRPDRLRVARLLGQPSAASGSAVAALLERHAEAVAARAVPLLDAAVGVDEHRQRLRWVRAVAGSALAGAADVPADRADQRDPADEDGTADEDTVDSQLARLVGFCAAGLAAPPTPPTQRPSPALGRGRAADKGKAKKRKRPLDGKS
jgi:AcrR family transcriptional regulator